MLREREFTRRREAGQPELEAWAAVATDARIGLVSWRGKESLPVPAAVRTFARFIARVSPELVADAVHRVEREAARLAEKNAATIQDIADGKFESPQVATVRLAAARERLKVVGIGADKQTRVSVTSHGQTAIGFGSVLRGALPPE